MDEKPMSTSEPASAAKRAWETPELTEHGRFRELTRFTSGTGPDDGFFDPGAASSAA
jgi:hypothetical protein